MNTTPNKRLGPAGSTPAAPPGRPAVVAQQGPAVTPGERLRRRERDASLHRVVALIRGGQVLISAHGDDETAEDGILAGEAIEGARLRSSSGTIRSTEGGSRRLGRGRCTGSVPARARLRSDAGVGVRAPNRRIQRRGKAARRIRGDGVGHEARRKSRSHVSSQRAIHDRRCPCGGEVLHNASRLRPGAGRLTRIRVSVA
jgi:hypothetical protein